MPEVLSMTLRIPVRLGRSKYGNVRCELDGLKFDSKKEMVRYAELKLLLQAGVISGLIADKAKLRYELPVNGQKICVYEADFAYLDQNNEVIVEDCKSPATRTAAYKLKRKLMKAIHGIEIREV